MLTSPTHALVRPRPDRRRSLRGVALAASLLLAGPLVAAVASAPAHAEGPGASVAATAVDKPVLVAAPVVYGDMRTGESVWTDEGQWNPYWATTRVQWLRDGAAIPGATSYQYRITSDDYLRRLSVRVTATVPGSAPAVADSLATVVQLGDAPVPVRKPAITGQPRVGTRLAVDAGAWAPSDTTFRYQWFRDNAEIAGATTATYTPAVEDVDSELMVRVDGYSNTLTGWTVVYTAPVKVLPGSGLAASTAPRINGTPEVGETLTADDGTWTPQGAVLQRQWLRNGAVIPGATGPQLVLTAADQGKSITLRVTGKLTGYADATAVSAPVLVAARAAVVSVTAPSLSGTPTIGDRLWVTAGTWQPSTVQVTYQWLRDGVSIPGETGSSYQLRGADADRQISVRVTGSEAGRPSATVTTTPVVVRRASSALSVKRAPLQVRPGQRTALVLTLRVPRDADTSGTVRVYDGARRVARVRVPEVGRTFTFAVPVQGLRGTGRHRLDAVYSGNAGTDGSSASVTVRVTRAR